MATFSPSKPLNRSARGVGRGIRPILSANSTFCIRLRLLRAMVKMMVGAPHVFERRRLCKGSSLQTEVEKFLLFRGLNAVYCNPLWWCSWLASPNRHNAAVNLFEVAAHLHRRPDDSR